MRSQFVNNDLIDFQGCQHIICKNCLLSYFNNNPNMKSDDELNIKCPIEGCNNAISFKFNDRMFNIINESKNKTLKKQLKQVKIQLIWGNVSFKKRFGIDNLADFFVIFRDIFEFLLCFKPIGNFCGKGKYSRCILGCIHELFFYPLEAIIIFSLPYYFIYGLIKYMEDINKSVVYFINNKYLALLIKIQIAIIYIMFSIIYFISSMVIYYPYIITVLILFFVY